MKGIVTHLEEWIFPDTEISEIGVIPILEVAQNGCKGIQLLLEVESDFAKVKVDTGYNFQVELYKMIDVPVEFNTENSTAQDGYFVIQRKLEEKPEYCSKLAPFRVYDCLEPESLDKDIRIKDGRLPIYVCFRPKEKLGPGKYPVSLIIDKDGKEETIPLLIQVYNVVIPEENLSVTNWFSIKNMATFHNAEYGSNQHLEMIRKYAKLMRRARQTHFFIQFEPERATVDLEKHIFDFTYLKPIIDIFFEEGFRTMEVGNFAIQYEDLFTDELKSSFDKRIKISSNEGYWITSDVIRAWKKFMQENDWENKVIYHICDEPDVHCKDELSMLKRKEQYFKIVNILHKHIPEAKVIEAIKSDKFKAGINIFVPITVALEDYIENCYEDYLKLLDEGNELWTYVCCAPSGNYLNRFLDIPLICSRLIFWGCSKYNLSGYLHWGLNQYVNNFNPFEKSCCPNDTGHGTSFPSGDGHMVYPGEVEPYMSMRLEAQRRGAEDFELLRQIKEKDEDVYKEIIDKMFTSFHNYNKDCKEFDHVLGRMLKYLEEKK